MKLLPIINTAVLITAAPFCAKAQLALPGTPNQEPFNVVVSLDNTASLNGSPLLLGGPLTWFFPTGTTLAAGDVLILDGASAAFLLRFPDQGGGQDFGEMEMFTAIQGIPAQLQSNLVTIDRSTLSFTTYDAAPAVYTLNIGPAVVPEPACIATLAAGISLLVAGTWRRRRKVF